MSDPAPAATPAPAPASGGLSSKVVLLVAGINLLATTGLAAVVVLRGNPAEHAAPAGEHDAAPAAVGEHGAAPAAAAPAGEHGAAAPAAAAPAGEHGAAPAAAAAPAGEHGGAPPAAGAAPPSTAMNTARLEDIVVHLRNPEVDRYARLTIDVEMATADEVKNLQDNVPRVRDAVITTLSEHTFEELRGGDGLQRMKGWLRDAIDDVTPGKVTAVYVSTFLVQ